MINNNNLLKQNALWGMSQSKCTLCVRLSFRPHMHREKGKTAAINCQCPKYTKAERVLLFSWYLVSDVNRLRELWEFEGSTSLNDCSSFESDSKMCSTRDFEKKMVCEYTTDTRSANHHRDGSHLATDVMLKNKRVQNTWTQTVAVLVLLPPNWCP